MEKKFSTGYKLRFGLAELGFTTLRAFGDFFMLFYYTDIARLNPAIVGSALLVGKLTWDAINDPLVGYLSDRTRSRFGRRRIYMLVAALPWFLSTWLQFSLPQGLAGATAFWVVLLTFWLRDTFGTLVGIPYNSLMADITHDYQERSNLALYKSAYAVLGYILGASGASLLIGLFRSMAMDRPQAWSLTGGIFGLVGMITLLITTLTIKEPPEVTERPVTISFLPAIRYCFQNKPFLILVAVFILGNFAFTIQASLLPYIIRYQLGMMDQISIIMVISLLTTGLFVIPAKLLADKINKAPAYAIGLLISAVTFLAAFFYLPYHPTPWVYVVAFFLGVGFSAHWVIPYAMMPDVVEYDEKITGERRAGIYAGVNNLILKFSSALATALPGWALAWVGYVPDAVQSEQALLGIRLFYAVIPAFVMIIMLPILLRYPITRESHATLRQELAETQSASD